MKASAAKSRDNPGQTPPTWRALLTATTAVAAVYVYFLIFAQFGFLKLLQASEGGAALLKPIMATMGAGGLVASAGMAWLYTEIRGRALLMTALAIAAVAAGLALSARSPAAFFAAAALTGLGAGGATVALAPQLRRLTGVARLGSCLGWGTGLAYGVCNLPPLFAAEPRYQAIAAIAVAGLGILATLGFGVPTLAPKTRESQPGAPGIVSWTILFLLLVSLDSAAFYAIQHTPALQQTTWAGDAQLYLNAIVHCATAVLAGWALSRGRMVQVVAVAALLLGGACVLLGWREPVGAPAALLYASGVSLYSTALVFYPASSERASVAAIVYAVAGWFGSALGIATAEQWQGIPRWLPLLIVGLLAILLVPPWREQRNMNKD